MKSRIDPTPHPNDLDVTQSSDDSTVLEVIEGYGSKGFTGDFFVETEQTVRCGECQSVLSATRLVMHSLRRFEGASDPDDMQVVIATTCPVCSSNGTMALSYGPMASAEDAAILLALQDCRDDDVLPASTPFTGDEIT